MQQLSRAEIDAFLSEELVGRIGCHAGGVTYVVPVVFAYDGEAVYAHTVEGMKLELMRANPRVCFEVDHYYRPGSWTSVIAQGRFEELEGSESRRALTRLAERFPGSERPAPNGNGIPGVSLRIVLDEVTGRKMRRSAGAVA